MKDDQDPTKPVFPAGAGRSAVQALRPPRELPPLVHPDLVQQVPTAAVDAQEQPPAPPRAGDGRRRPLREPVAPPTSPASPGSGHDLVSSLLREGAMSADPPRGVFPEFVARSSVDARGHLVPPSAPSGSPMRPPERGGGMQRQPGDPFDLAGELLSIPGAREVASTASTSGPSSPGMRPAPAAVRGDPFGQSATSMLVTEPTAPMMGIDPSEDALARAVQRWGRAQTVIEAHAGFEHIVDALLAPSLSPAQTDDVASPFGAAQAETVAAPSSPASDATMRGSTGSLHYTTVLERAATSGRPATAASSGSSTPGHEGATRPAPGGTPR